MQSDLYAHQQAFLNKNPKRYLLAHATGTGKTLIAILHSKNKHPTLFIVPKVLKENWERYCKLYELKVYTILSKEEFRKVHKTLTRYKSVVVDECHFFGNYRSQLAKALNWYFKKHDTEYRLFLSATPRLASPWSIFTLAVLLGHPLEWYQFKNKFFYDVRMGLRTIPMPRPNMDGELAKIIHTIGETVRLEDCVDLPPQNFLQEYIDITEEQRKALFTISDILPLVRFTKAHQIINGYQSSLIGEPKPLKDNKIERIIALCEENNKTAIFARYNFQLELYKRAIESSKELKNHKVFLITGETKNRDALIQEAEQAEKCIVLINCMCGIGWEIPSISVIVFASLSYSFID
ncbi:MAG: SNF2-related protein, partial [Patescibacteria group bacterium]